MILFHIPFTHWDKILMMLSELAGSYYALPGLLVTEMVPSASAAPVPFLKFITEEILLTPTTKGSYFIYGFAHSSMANSNRL